MDDVEYRIGRLALAPDDVLVVKINHVASKEMHHRVMNYVASVVNEGTKILVIDHSVDLSVLTREEIERCHD